MKRLHDRLMRSSRWYNRWHRDKYANQLSWMLFFTFALSYTTVILAEV